MWNEECANRNISIIRFSLNSTASTFLTNATISVLNISNVAAITGMLELKIRSFDVDLL